MSVLHCVGKGMVRLHLKRRADSGELYRHTAGWREEWVLLGNSHIPYNCDESRKQTVRNELCLFDR